jgi:hypothetical protein
VISVKISPGKKYLAWQQVFFSEILKTISSQSLLSFFQRHNAAFLPLWLGLPLAEFTFTQKTEQSHFLSLSLHNVFSRNFTEIERGH